MASKTRRRQQKERRRAIASATPGNIAFANSQNNDSGIAKRPKGLKHKKKIRLGHQTAYDIYEEFEIKNEQLQTENICDKCSKPVRTKAFCVWCATDEQ